MKNQVRSNRNAGIIKQMIDWIVIIIEISYHLSFVASFSLYLIPVNGNFLLFSLVLFLHLIRFGLKFKLLQLVPKNTILVIFVLIYLFDFLQYTFIHDPLYAPLILLLNMLVFMSYLYNMYEDAIKVQHVPFVKYTAPFIGYSVYNIIVIVILAILIIFTGASYEQNPISQDDPMISGRYDWAMQTFFPYHLCIAMNYHDGINLLGIPVLTGLSHEPHVIMFLIMPAWMFIFATDIKYYLKTIISIIYLFVLIETTSTTAILCFGVILLVETLWKSRQKRTWKVVIVVVSVYMVTFFDGIMTLVSYKLSGVDGSSGTSTSMLEYLVSFDGIFGEGNWPTKYGEQLKNSSAGIVTGILDATLYLYILCTALRFTNSRNSMTHYLGLGCLYFTLHGIKTNYLMVAYPYLAYMFFLLFLMRIYEKRHKSCVTQFSNHA